MSLSLHPRMSREQLPLDTACDFDLTVTLRNDGADPITIYPRAAKLGPIFSYAGIGITWSLELAAADGTKWPLQELRTWYGPPGNPPAPSWANEHAVKLARGKEHVENFALAWLPNTVLEPRHLDAKTLDPEGMDHIASPPKYGSHPTVADRIELAKSNVLVFNRLAALDTKKDDFLRGNVVGFVPTARVYELRIAYVQDSFMKVGEKVVSNVAPVRFEVG